MTEPYVRQVALHIPEDLFQRLEAYARDQGLGVEGTVVEAIRYYLVAKPVEHGRPLYSSE